MQTFANHEQAAVWNGYDGLHWAAHQDRWDAVNGGFNDYLFDAAAIGAHDRVLDVGCGTGQTARHAARRATLGRVVGVDLSAPMLERARTSAVADGITNVTFEQGDAQVHPFPHGGFDVAISRFAVMFFDDPIAAFANIGRALRPGGRLAFLTMGDISRNEWMHVLSAMREFVPVLDDLRPGGPGMFSLAEPDHIHEVLSGAGFDAITTTPVEAPMCFGRDADDTAAFLLSSGPARFILDQVDQASQNRGRQAITTVLRPHERPDGVWLRGAAWLVGAARPSGQRIDAIEDGRHEQRSPTA
ncbi:MAG: class I SAM-dependent methyltransferase [Dehalococcoidia bacterium]